MCLVETRNYVYPTGRMEVIETLKPCKYGTTIRPCHQLSRRNLGNIRMAGSMSPTRSLWYVSESVTDLDAERERPRVYVDRRRRALVRRRNTPSQLSPLEPPPDHKNSRPAKPASRFPPRVIETMPRAPTPPLATYGNLPKDGHPPRSRAAHSDTVDGSVIDDFPPAIKPLDPAGNAGDSRPLALSTKTTVPREFIPSPTTSNIRRPVKVVIDTSKDVLLAGFSPTMSTPGLSRLSSVGSEFKRHDSARASYSSSNGSIFGDHGQPLEWMNDYANPDQSSKVVENEECRQARLERGRYIAREQIRADSAVNYKEQDRLRARAQIRTENAVGYQEQDRLRDREQRRAGTAAAFQASEVTPPHDRSRGDDDSVRWKDAVDKQGKQERAAADYMELSGQQAPPRYEDAYGRWLGAAAHETWPGARPDQRQSRYGSVAVHQSPSVSQSSRSREEELDYLVQERARAAVDKMNDSVRDMHLGTTDGDNGSRIETRRTKKKRAGM